MRKLLSELSYGLALLVLCTALGYLIGLALSALLSSSIVSVPFWIRRIAPYLFPAYGLVLGLYLSGQELVASYVNAKIFRQAADHLGPDRRLIRQGAAETARDGEQQELVFRSSDARRQIRISRGDGPERRPQIAVHFDVLQMPQQIYQEVERRSLKRSEIERILQLERSYFQTEHDRYTAA